jgi:hypothetical protein
VDRLLDDCSYSQIASSLNERGFRSGEGNRFTPVYIARIQRCYALQSRYDRLRNKGLLTLAEMANILGISMCQVKIWRRHGLVRGHPYNDKNECLFEHPGDHPPTKAQGVKLSRRRPVDQVTVERPQEVQCET